MNKKEALEVLQRELNECEVRCDGPHIVVLDKGWIFHGNLIPPNEEHNHYRLTSCVNVRKWEKGGFGGLSKGAKIAEATLDNCEPIVFSEKSLIFTVPTNDNWRLT